MASNLPDNMQGGTSLSYPDLGFARSRLMLDPPNDTRGKEGLVDNTCLPEAAGMLYAPRSIRGQRLHNPSIKDDPMTLTIK